jgi:hypothetical protein
MSAGTLRWRLSETYREGTGKVQGRYREGTAMAALGDLDQ